MPTDHLRTDTLEVPLNRGMMITYVITLTLLLGSLLVLLYRAPEWGSESLLIVGLFVVVILICGPEIRTALLTRYCLRADGREIRVGCWRHEVRIPWAAVARLECIHPAWNRNGVQNLVIFLKDERPGPACMDGTPLNKVPKTISVRGTFIDGDCHEIKNRLDALLTSFGQPESEIPKL